MPKDLSAEIIDQAKLMGIEPKVLVEIKNITGSKLEKYYIRYSVADFVNREIENYRVRLESMAEGLFTSMNQEQKKEYVERGVARLNPSKPTDAEPYVEIEGISYMLKLDHIIPQLRAVREILSKPFSTYYIESDGQAVLLNGIGQFQFLKMVGTNGVNSGYENEELISKLRQWHRSYGLEIHGAGSDWIDLELKKLPSNVANFVKKAWQFCPDLIENPEDESSCKRSFEDFIAQFAQEKRLQFWWD